MLFDKKPGRMRTGNRLLPAALPARVFTLVLLGLPLVIWTLGLLVIMTVSGALAVAQQQLQPGSSASDLAAQTSIKVSAFKVKSLCWEKNAFAFRSGHV